MRKKRNNPAYLHHILDAAEKVLDYASQHSFNEFANDIQRVLESEEKLVVDELVT